MKRWKASGAFMKLKVITLSWKMPCGVTKAIFHSLPGWMRSWLYPDFMLNLEKYLESHTVAKVGEVSDVAQVAQVCKGEMTER